MAQAYERSAGALLAATLIALGAVLGIASVFLPWAEVTDAAFRGGTVLGEVVPSAEELGIPTFADPSGTGLPSIAGVGDAGGFLAAVLFAAALAAAVLAASRARGLGALGALGSGSVALIVGLASLFRSGSIATAGLRDELHREAADVLGYNPLLGGLFDRLLDETIALFSFEARPGVGLFLAIGAALLVVVGGWLALPPERTTAGTAAADGPPVAALAQEQRATAVPAPEPEPGVPLPDPPP